MRAMLLPAPRPVEEAPLVPAELPEPQPAPGQVRLRVHVCAVCHTDLHTVEGDLPLPRLPLVPGHQIVGVVDALGEGVPATRLGERVGAGWLNGLEGPCDLAQQGLENLCPNLRFTGLDVDGGYAQHAIVSADYAFALPEGFDDTAAAPLLCAGIIGYRSLRLSEIKPGGTLGLFGFGASAHLAIQVARHWGCTVYVFTRSEEHRHLARELGAAWAGAAEDTPPTLLDAGITFAPAGRLVPLALGHLRPGGTLALNAVTMSPIPELDYRLLYMERTLRSVANYTRADALEFLDLAARIPIRSEIEVFPLEQANEALQRLKHSRIRGSAVLAVG